jgi:hypothetical protein
MENSIARNHHHYFDCTHRLQYLMNVQPQTDLVKKEIELLQAELEKLDRIRAN